MPRARKDYPAEAVRERTGRELPDLLRELYVDKRHSAQEIADALGLTRSLVAKRLRILGITRDDRSAVIL